MSKTLTLKINPATVAWGDSCPATHAVSAVTFASELSKFTNGFTTQDVVNAARSKSSPIHPLFEWNDKIAGEKWRKLQAREYVHKLKVIVDSKTGQRQISAYHSIKVCEGQNTAESHRYFSVQTVAKSRDMRDSVLNNAIRDLKAWRERYAALADVLGPVFDAIANWEDSVVSNQPDSELAQLIAK